MKCRQCGKEFEPEHGNQRYCSLVCRDRHSGRNTHSTGTEGTCRECGATFIKSYGSEKYCSVECRRIYANKHKENGYVKKAPIAFACEFCGRMSFTNNPRARYCSEECKNKASWIHEIESKYGSVRKYQDHKKLKSIERKKAKEEKLVQLEKERKAREQERLKKRALATQLKEQQKKERILTKDCVVCGRTFTTLNPVQKTCSKHCGKRLNQSRKHHRIPKKQIIDKDITLEALYRRDSGVCYLCGKLCDWNDRDEKQNIVGSLYPSVDHVIPISRGGLHAWSNVRLAHFECNWKKNDKLIEEIGEACNVIGASARTSA